MQFFRIFPPGLRLGYALDRVFLRDFECSGVREFNGKDGRNIIFCKINDLGSNARAEMGLTWLRVRTMRHRLKPSNVNWVRPFSRMTSSVRCALKNPAISPEMTATARGALPGSFFLPSIRP